MKVWVLVSRLGIMQPDTVRATRPPAFMEILASKSGGRWIVANLTEAGP